MPQPHETPQFANSTEYTVTITFRVEGGARWQTAHRRARQIAERLANNAARAAGVVDVTAIGGASWDGKPLSTETIRFSAANSGHGTGENPTRFDRYLDPEFERGLRSLAEVRAAARQTSEADRRRRQDLGCLNTSRSPSLPAARCLCIYCEPAAYEHALQRAEAGTPDLLTTPRCICGRAVGTPGLRCTEHRGHDLVLLDDDPSPLRRLAQRNRADEAPDRSRGIDGPELPPLGH